MSRFTLRTVSRSSSATLPFHSAPYQKPRGSPRIQSLQQRPTQKPCVMPKEGENCADPKVRSLEQYPSSPWHMDVAVCNFFWLLTIKTQIQPDENLLFLPCGTRSADIITSSVKLNVTKFFRPQPICVSSSKFTWLLPASVCALDGLSESNRLPTL